MGRMMSRSMSTEDGDGETGKSLGGASDCNPTATGIWRALLARVFRPRRPSSHAPRPLGKELGLNLPPKGNHRVRAYRDRASRRAPAPEARAVSLCGPSRLAVETGLEEEGLRKSSIHSIIQVRGFVRRATPGGHTRCWPRVWQRGRAALCVRVVGNSHLLPLSSSFFLLFDYWRFRKIV